MLVTFAERSREIRSTAALRSLKNPTKLEFLTGYSHENLSSAGAPDHPAALRFGDGRAVDRVRGKFIGD